MPAPQYDMEQMIANIKRRCAVPTSQLTYTEDDFTKLCTDELQDEVVPLLMSTREDFFVEPYDTTVSSTGVMPFPANTVASKVRNICFMQQTSPLILANLPRIDLDVVAGVGYFNYSTLAGFYVQGNDFVLWPPQSLPVGTNIRVYIYRRTLVLAQPSAYGQVVSVDTRAKTVVLDSVPPVWIVGTVLNSINGTTPFNITNDAMTITTLSSPTIELDTVDGISVGDFISEQGFSAIPQIPIEAHGYLAQLTAAKALEGLGDHAGLEAALARAEKLKDNLMIMISQRVDGSVKKVMNPSGGLRLGAGIGRWGYGWSGGTF